MTAYKEENGTWRTTFRYTDWTGAKKQTTKRGFKTKREALQYEEQFKAKTKADMSILLKDFVEIYFRDKDDELKASSIKNKKNVVEAHILPYFGERKMSEITPAEIIQWQKKIKEKGFSETYEREIQKQLTAIYNHAINIYDHTTNPCNKVSKMGKARTKNLKFWTIDEYKQFRSVIEEGSENYLIFEILFWTGCREGELLALTPNDFDFQNNLLYINKTFNRIDGEDIVDTPKTECSVRTIVIPNFLNEEVQNYIKSRYGMPGNERIFPIVHRTLQKRMEKLIEKADVRKITVHDLRHSHVAYLIHQGVEPLVIKERLGHTDIRMTLNVYGHLYPSKQRSVAKMLDQER